MKIMRLKILFVIGCALTLWSNAWAQQDDEFERYRQQYENQFNQFRSQREKEFQEFRDRINQEYASFLRQTWDEFNAFRGIKRPDNDKPIPPVVCPDDDRDKPIKDTPKPFEEVIPVVKNDPQPEPVVPILEDKTPVPTEEDFTFTTYGTKVTLRIPANARFKMNSIDGEDIARAWERLSDNRYNVVINDCIKLRKELNLCDYAYLNMLWDFSRTLYGKDCKEAVMLMAFLYCQSGYKMRIATDGTNLLMLYASKHRIYEYRYWVLGDGYHYYAFNSDAERILLSDHAFPNEKPMSLLVGVEQNLALLKTTNRSLQSKRYSDTRATVGVNENLIKFYDKFPSSQIDDDFGTRWAMYANTPICTHARSTLYPSLINAIDGLGQLEAANKLLNFVQTAFVYEYDDKVWGQDRAFFPDETLYYPYCDCEDRSILFSRLVRDLLGLEVVLIYYPGHLATAVHFTDQVSGDYIMVNSKKYVISDPTYINAPVGLTMRGMDNGQAKVIMLE